MLKPNGNPNAPLPAPKYQHNVPPPPSSTTVAMVEESEDDEEQVDHSEQMGRREIGPPEPENLEKDSKPMQSDAGRYSWASPILSALHPHPSRSSKPADSMAASSAAVDAPHASTKLRWEHQAPEVTVSESQSDTALLSGTNYSKEPQPNTITAASIDSGSVYSRDGGAYAPPELAQSIGSTGSSDGTTNSAKIRGDAAKDVSDAPKAHVEETVPLTPSLPTFSSRFRAKQSRDKSSNGSSLELLKTQQSDDLRISNLVRCVLSQTFISNIVACLYMPNSCHLPANGLTINSIYLGEQSGRYGKFVYGTPSERKTY